MNQPTLDILAFLLNNGYENIHIDEFQTYDPPDNEANDNQIMIKDAALPIPANQSVYEIDFGIYVKNRDARLAKSTSVAIQNLLANKGGLLTNTGEPVPFKWILIDASTHLFGKTSNNVSIYMARYTAIISDDDINVS